MAPVIKQLLAGDDFARNDHVAAQMANFVYLIGDETSRKCVLVDPAWDVEGILNQVESNGFELEGVLVTHYHPDHVGGSMFGFSLEGVAELLARNGVKVHANEHEVQGLMQVTGLSRNDIVAHSGGDRLSLGDTSITFLHTPGHTPGSQCFIVDSNLVSGDTLFISGCGRVDLPGGNSQEMYDSLTKVLAKVPDQTILYPGHNYSSERSSAMGRVKRENFVLRMNDYSDWVRFMD